MLVPQRAQRCSPAKTVIQACGNLLEKYFRPPTLRLLECADSCILGGLEAVSPSHPYIANKQ